MLEETFPRGCAAEEDSCEALKFGAMNQFLELGGDEGKIELFEWDVGEIAVFKFFPVPDDKLALGEMRSKVLHESADMVEREDAEAINLLGLEVVLSGVNRVAECVEGMSGEFWLVSSSASGNIYCDFGGDLRGRNWRYASLGSIWVA